MFWGLFSAFSPSWVPPGHLRTQENIAFSRKNPNFKARFWVRRMNQEKGRKKEEGCANRNKFPSTIARTGTFCSSRVKKPRQRLCLPNTDTSYSRQSGADSREFIHSILFKFLQLAVSLKTLSMDYRRKRLVQEIIPSAFSLLMQPP